MTATIPVARALPVLGSSLALMQDPLAFLRAEYLRLGPVFRIGAAGRSFVVLAGPEANRFATSKGRDAFSSRAFWGPMLDRMGCPHAILGMDGPPHMTLRRAFRKDLSRKVVEPELDAVLDTIDRVTSETLGDGPVSARTYTSLLVSAAISRLITGMDVPASSETIESMLEFQRWQMNALLLRKWPRAMLWLPRFKRHEADTEAFVDDLVAITSAQTPEGWFASMERVRDTHPELFGTGEVRMHHLLPYFAGVDTVGVTLAFALVELLLDGATLWHQVQAEVDAASEGGALPPLDTLLQLPLLNGVKREVMRLYPAAFGVYRTAARDFTFRDCDVEAGQDVLLFTTAAHTDPSVFADPMRFDPTRPAEDFKDTHAFAPYGKGPHACLGAGMAEVLLTVILARWVHKHRFLADLDTRPGMHFDPTPSPPRSFTVGWQARA